jgi:hemerythrin-like domain-containing protein
MAEESDSPSKQGVKVASISVVEPNSTVLYTLADQLEDEEWRKLIGEIFPTMSEDTLTQQIEGFKRTAQRLKPYQKLELIEATCYLICKGKLRAHITQDNFLDYDRKELLLISPALPGIWMGGPNGVVLLEIKSNKVMNMMFTEHRESVLYLPRLEEYLKQVSQGGAEDDSSEDTIAELKVEIEDLKMKLVKKNKKIKYLVESIQKIQNYFNQVLGKQPD